MPMSSPLSTCPGVGQGSSGPGPSAVHTVPSGATGHLQPPRPLRTEQGGLAASRYFKEEKNSALRADFGSLSIAFLSRRYSMRISASEWNF